jgi:DnaJ family protein C protein 1
MQYMVQKMNYNRDLARIETIIQNAKTAAWGNKLIPADGQKKVRYP